MRAIAQTGIARSLPMFAHQVVFSKYYDLTGVFIYIFDRLHSQIIGILSQN